MEKVSLTEIAGGALQEKFNRAFKNVIENLADPNTPFKEARKITMTLTFTQNEQRSDVNCDVHVTEKLSAQAHTKTGFAVGKDLKTGTLYAEEYGKNHHQLSFPEIKVDTETGEVIDEQSPNPIIIDLRSKMQKVNCN